MVDDEKVLKLALTAGNCQTPTVTVTDRGEATVATPFGACRRIGVMPGDELLLARRVAAPGVATLVVRRRGVDRRAMAVDALAFTVTVPKSSIVGSDYAPRDAQMVLDLVSAV